jgi:hypothetical protein
MLNVHGLVIVASEIVWEQAYQHTTIVKFEVASEALSGETTRHMISISIPNDKVQSFKQDLEVGKVCEIVLANLDEKPIKNSENYIKKYTYIEFRTRYENFRILQPCIYYSGLKNITESVATNE